MTKSEINEKIYDHRILSDWSNATQMHYSKDMIFNDGHRLSITVYSILFVLSTIGNTTVLYLLTKRRLRGPSRIDIMLMHLAIADLLVTFLLMPLEIVWAYTVEWKSTDFVCRLMSFFRVFGLYLSSFVLVCISIDRYFAILKPLKLSTNRGRIMLAVAWVSSVICSAPQAFLFHVEEHPHVKGYSQCVTFNSFPSEFHQLFYNIANMCAMYAFPLVTFIYCYGAIYLEIYRRSQTILKGVERFRRSNDDVLGRAKKRTLKMTITIVAAFIICWTPYYIICMWYWFDQTSVDKVSSLVRKALFIFASTNSCMNPVVYGVFNIRGRTSNTNASTYNRHTLSTNRMDSSNQLQKNILTNAINTANNNNKNTTTIATATTPVAAAIVRIKSVCRNITDDADNDASVATPSGNGNCNEKPLNGNSNGGAIITALTQKPQQQQQQQILTTITKAKLFDGETNMTTTTTTTSPPLTTPTSVMTDVTSIEDVAYEPKNYIEEIPMIPINCADSLELANLQKKA